MAVQVINPVDTKFPMSSSAVETEAETEDQFAWVFLLCCTYSTPITTDIDTDFEDDIDV